MRFFEHAFNTSGSKADKVIYLILALCIIIPISFINSLKKYARINLIANILIIICLIAIVGYAIENMSNINILKNNRKNFADFS
jgi:hypothetical protein